MIKLKPKIFLVLSGLIFLLLFIGTPFLHNHEADLHVHQDCPAFLMELFLQSCLIYLFIICLTIFPSIENFYPEYIKIFLQSLLFFSARKRAPPAND
jgi:hypothetical protein